MSKVRSFAFTDFIMDKSFYTKIKYEYLVLGLETCPETKRQHYQGYIYFENPRSIKAIRDKFKPRHIEAAISSPSQNRQYCTKDGKFEEFGILPQQGRRSDLEDAIDLVKEGGLEKCAEEKPAAFVKFHKGLERLSAILQPKRQWKSFVTVLWGPTGTGKTRKAIEEGGEIIEYTQSGFFQNYRNQEHVIFDDFDGSMPRDLFLKITDRYSMTVNVKGGEMQWNPKKITFTSNFDPKKWILYDEAVKRRLDNVEHMSGTEVAR